MKVVTGKVEQPKDYFLDLSKFRKNVYSQNGEDGVIERLFTLLGVKNGWCCEFGAWDGRHLSNTFNLINKGWKGVMIEGDRAKFKKLAKTQRLFPGRIVSIREYVHYLPGMGRLIDDILSGTSIPIDFDLISIDVDGPDYHIWKSMTRYRPKVVIIEHSGIDGEIIQREGAIHKKEVDGSTSFWSMKRLGEDKGYRLVVDTGNMIFVDGYLISGLEHSSEHTVH